MPTSWERGTVGLVDKSDRCGMPDLSTLAVGCYGIMFLIRSTSYIFSFAGKFSPSLVVGKSTAPIGSGANLADLATCEYLRGYE